MKIKLYLSFLIAILFSPLLKAQCNDVTLSSQADVDSFQSNYGCSVVNGNLTIAGDDITNLDGLSGITAIANSLIIRDNPELLNLDGLSHLTAVGTSGNGMINIAQNYKLQSIAGLASVTSVAYDSGYVNSSIYIQSNFELTSLHGLEGLTGTLPGGIGLYENSKLANIDALAGITAVNHLVELFLNSSLKNLDGFRNLRTVKYGFYLTQNPGLENVNGLASLESIQNIGDNSTLSIRSNSALKNLDSLSSLVEIMGPKKTVIVTQNSNLLNGCGIFPVLNSVVNCNGCESVIDISENRESVTKEIILANGNCRSTNPTSCAGDIVLSSQSEIDAFRVTRGCPVVEGSVTITGGDITNLDGLSDITSIGNSLNIVDNPALTNVNGLRALKSIKATGENSTYLRIDNNPGLTNVNGLASLVEMTGTGRTLEITDNPMLDSGCGLFPLVSTNFPCGNNCQGDVHLTITGTPISWEEIMNGGGCGCAGTIMLSSQAAVDAFPVTHGCKIAASTITITGGDIVNLDGLHSLDTIRGSLTIQDNPELLNIDGLSNLKSVASKTYGGIFIVSNARLTNIDGLSSVSDVGYNSGFGNSSITIASNSGLTSIEGLIGIKRLPGNLLISDNDALTNLDGLDSLKAIDIVGTLSISGNDALVDTDGLKGLTRVAVNLEISNNSSLPNLNGLSSLTALAIGGFSGQLRIENNASLANVDSLSSLISMTTIYRYLIVRNNPNLTRGCGFYPLLANSFDCSLCNTTITFENNGAGVTKDEILADGACEGVDPQLPQQPTNLVFSQVTGESVHLEFTVSPHPPAYHVILMRTMSSPYPEDKPQNGSYYYAGMTIGNSLVVAVGEKGDVNEFDITGLSPSTEYYFAVYAGNSGLNYVKDPPLQGSVTTSGGGTPTDLVFSDVTDNSLTISFAAAEGYDGYLTIMRSFESGLPSDGPVNGTSYSIGNVINCCTIVVGNGTSTELFIIYLEPDIDYYFDVIPYTIEDSSYVYHLDNVLSGHQRTMEEAQPFPNPFVEQLTIPVTVSGEIANVRILITDQLGRQVSEVVNNQFATGKHFVQWDRIDQQGRRLNQGVYMYSIITSETDKPITGMVVAK